MRTVATSPTAPDSARRLRWRRPARSMSGITSSSAAASPAVTTATAYAARNDVRLITAAPTNGPMNSPIRCAPPSIDSARARRCSGATSVR